MQGAQSSLSSDSAAENRSLKIVSNREGEKREPRKENLPSFSSSSSLSKRGGDEKRKVLRGEKKRREGAISY